MHSAPADMPSEPEEELITPQTSKPAHSAPPPAGKLEPKARLIIEEVTYDLSTDEEGDDMIFPMKAKTVEEPPRQVCPVAVAIPSRHVLRS